MNEILITTSQGGGIPREVELQGFLQQTGVPFYPRHKRSLAQMMLEYETELILVWQQNGPILHLPGGETFFFHPSMAKSRIAHHRKRGGTDNLVRACALEAGDDFLDCTMGLGADAIVASYFTPAGRVLGLESSWPVYLVVKWGMVLYQSRMQWLEEAVKRIEVEYTDHYSYLKQCPDGSHDIVYFDPMFRQPAWKSQAISALRRLGDARALDPGSIEQACRVARKRVILKEKTDGGEFERLGFSIIHSSKNNPIAYGEIPTG